MGRASLSNGILKPAPNHTGMGCIHERETPTLGGEVERLVDMIFKQRIFVGFV